jgi:uroporphyrinogen III methyltransferase/synthase
MSAGTRTLAGRRIVVTRRREQAAPLVRLLEERGATVLVVPATTVGVPPDCRSLDDALLRLDGFDWVVFTSANAVTAVRDRLAMLGAGAALGARVASVGPATTRALADAFPETTVALEPDTDFRAAGLISAFRERGGLGGACVLVPASSLARPELPRGLRALGATVTVTVAYTTREPPDLQGAVSRCLDAGFDAVTFAAPSAAQAFAAAARERGAGLPAAVIGPTTEAAARSAGFSVLAVASPSTAEGLVAALEGALGSPPPTR